MATRANLIATYNSNPTLQSRYTLPQYLDMFGFGTTATTTTTTPTTTPTPTPEVPGIPNIINQNLGGSGGGDGVGPQGIATPSATLQKTYDPTKELSVGEYFSGVEGSPIYTSTYTERKNPIEGLMELYQKFSPIGMIGRKIQQNKEFKQAQTNKALEQVKMQEEIRKAEAAAAAAAAAQAAALANAQRTGRRPTAPRGSGIQDSQSLGNPSAGQTGGFSYDSGGRQGFGYGLADGGRVYLYNRLK